MIFNIITIFPEIFSSYFNESIIKRAQEKNKISINIINLRDYAGNKHKKIDDTPYGGGAGMVMKIEPLYQALNSPLIINTPVNSPLKKNATVNSPLIRGARGVKSKIILLSPKGKTWNQQMAKKYSKLDNLILICGRYEGVDERITNFIDEEISIGDYVLTGGEIPAMILVDSITRLIPNVLGNNESIISESHSQKNILEYAHYTKPPVFEANDKKYEVPKVLLSGNHQEIEKWRINMLKKKK